VPTASHGALPWRRSGSLVGAYGGGTRSPVPGSCRCLNARCRDDPAGIHPLITPRCRRRAAHDLVGVPYHGLVPSGTYGLLLRHSVGVAARFPRNVDARKVAGTPNRERAGPF